MRLYLNVTSWPNGRKNDPVQGLIEGNLTLTDEDLLRLAQILFTAATVASTPRPKSATPGEAANAGKELLEHVRKLKLPGRASEYNDEARQAHLASMRVSTARENELAQALRAAINKHLETGNATAATHDEIVRWTNLIGHEQLNLPLEEKGPK